MTAFPIQELTIRPGFTNQYAFTIENTTANPSMAAVEIEQLKESLQHFADIFTTTITEIGKVDEIAGPLSLSALYANGYTPLSSVGPGEKREYLLTLTTNTELQSTFQLQQMSFDMKVGVETMTPSPSPTPSPTAIPSPTPSPSPTIIALTAINSSPTPSTSPTPSGQVLGLATQTQSQHAASPPTFQQYLPLFLSLALLIGVITFYALSIFSPRHR